MPSLLLDKNSVMPEMVAPVHGRLLPHKAGIWRSLARTQDEAMHKENRE